jgi:tetratricopeptide (TPR) repeat protein
MTRSCRPNLRQWKRRQRGLMCVIVAVGSLMTIGIAAALRRETISPPPQVDLAGADPAVADLLRTAQNEVRKAPGSSAAWGHLGMLLFAYDFLPPAQECFRQAQRLEPNEPSWPYYLALALRFDKPQEALALLRRTVQLCGDQPDAPRLLLAELLFQEGQAEESERQFHLALEANPSSPRAQMGLARLALERDDLQGGQELLNQAVLNTYAEQSARALLAQIEQRLGNEHAAEQERRRAERAARPLAWPDPYLEKVLQLRIGRQAGIDRINRLLAEDRDAEAAAEAERILRAYPDSGVAWFLLGEARMRQRQLQAAEAALQRAVQLMPESAEVHLVLGASLFEQQEYGEAAACFRRVTELKPSSASAYYDLGRCLVKLGDGDGAQDAFEKALRNQPQFAKAHRNLGLLLSRKGRSAKAAEHLRAALQFDPEDTEARKELEQLRKQGGAADDRPPEP